MSGCGTIELACLGRPFQLGMLYDCRSDTLIPGITLWDPEILQKNINVRLQPNTDFNIIASDSTEDKADALKVDASLEASFLCGLVHVKGSAHFLNDKKKSKKQSRVTLQYRTTTRFEQLTMEQLGAGNFKHCSVFQEGSATHVVTGLLYGAQAFFIFDREVSSNENFQEIQGDLHASIKKIPTITIEGEASLKMTDQEQQKLDKFSCTFHGDFALENNPVSYLDAIKVYGELPKMLGEKGKNAIPVTVWLYPLQKLDSAAAQLVREISCSLVRRSQRIMNDLGDCEVQCQDLMRNNVAILFPEIRAKLRQFKDFCSEFKMVFQKDLCKLLPSIRGGGKDEQELIDALKRVERSPFQSGLLTEYLEDREKEICTVQSYLDIMKNIPVHPSNNDLDKFVLKATSEYVVAFALSSLNEQEPYVLILEAYLKEQSDVGNPSSYDLDSIKKPKWFSSRDATAQNRENMQAFLNFKQANKERTTTEFCIASVPGNLDACTSIYVFEKGQLVSSAFALPSKPPSPVILSVEHDHINLQIKPPAHGEKSVHSYCISYQSAESDEWTEVYTDGVSDQFAVQQLKPHKEYRFNVKAVCRPGVSLPSDPTSLYLTRPCAPPGAPVLKRTDSESATLSWDVPASVGEDLLINQYLLEYRECTKDQKSTMPWKSVKSTSRDCTIQGLRADTVYEVRVLAKCDVDKLSLPSMETVFSTGVMVEQTREEGSELFLKQSTLFQKGNPAIHTLKLHHKMQESDNFNQYVFGQKVEDAKNKVLLILGATGAGKTTLINVMANYILGVKWQDGFRFKLINELTFRSQAESQTSIVSSYELYNQPGFKIPYSLTIIDTPGFGDTRGISHDKEITKQMKSFLCSPLGINHIDAICFVVQASLSRLTTSQKYIFDSVLSIFGKDIAENILFLVTFADGKDTPVLEAIKAAELPCQKDGKGNPTHFKFNNSAMYAEKTSKLPATTESDSDDDEDDDENMTKMVWDKTFRQLRAFFKTLGTLESKDLTLTKQVLEERERLEQVMESLTPQITAGLNKLSEIKSLKQCLQNESNNMKQNANFEHEVLTTVANRTPVDYYTMNCNKCFFTCHSNCFLPIQDEPRSCAVMNDSGHCIICPGNCHSSVHLKEKIMWKYEQVKETKTIEELKKNFMDAQGKFMNTTQIIGKLENEFSVIEDKLMNLIKQSSDCIRRLDEIALKPKSVSTDEYIEIMIKSEKDEKKPGFEDRVAGLENMKQQNLLKDKIAKGDRLLK